MELFKLFGSVMIDNQKAIDALNKTETAGKKTHDILGKIGKVALIAGAALVTGFGAALADGIKGATEAEDAIAQLDAVLESTGGAAGMTKEGLVGMANELQRTTKFTAESALAAESLLLTFTNIGKDTFPRATQAAADMATALGTDMAGQSIVLGKALNDPTKGITALTRVGVSFTAQQKAQIKAMQASGDMAGAQAIILAELEKEFGGSAAAAGETFTGTLVRLKNAFGEITENLATQFMPYLSRFVDWIASNMPAIQAVMQTVFDGMGNAISFIVGVIKDYLIPAFQTIWDWIAPTLPVIKQFFVDAFEKAKEVAMNLYSAFNENILPILQKLWDWIEPNLPAIKQFFIDAFESAKTVAMNLYNIFNENILPILQQLWEWIEPNLPAIKQFFVDTFEKAKEVIIGVVDAVKDLTKWISDHWTIVGPILAGITAAFVSYRIAMGLLTAVKIAWTAATTIATAAGTAFAAVLAFITSPIGIVVIAIGALIAIGLLLYKNWDVISAFLKNIWNGISSTASNIFNGIKNTIVGVWDNIVDGVTGAVTKLKDALSKAFTGIKNVVTGIWDGLVDGIKSGINWIIKAINGFTGGLNKIQIPDWVPAVGGMGINIPAIPLLAKGLDYVPYDEFPAILHKGERVMTAEENAQGSGGQIDYDKIGAAVAKAIEGMGISVNDREFGRVIRDYA